MFENRSWCPKWQFVVLLLFFDSFIKGKKLNEEDDILDQVIPHRIERRKFSRPHNAVHRLPKRGFLPESALSLPNGASLNGLNLNGLNLNGLNSNGVLPASFSQQLAQADDQNIHAANEGSNMVQDMSDQSESAQDASLKTKAPETHEAGEAGQDFYGTSSKPSPLPPSQATADISQYGLWEYGLDDTKGGNVDDSNKAPITGQYAQQAQDQTQEEAQKIPGMEQGGISQVVDANKMASILGNDININGAKIGSELDNAEQLLAQQANEQNAVATTQSNQISDAANAVPEADANGSIGSVTEGGAVTTTTEGGMPLQNGENSPGSVSVVNLPNAMTIEDEHGNLIKPFTTNGLANHHNNGKPKAASLQTHTPGKAGDSAMLQQVGQQPAKVSGNVMNNAAQGESLKYPSIMSMLNQQSEGAAKDANEQHIGGENKDTKLLKIIKNLLKPGTEASDNGHEELENKEIMELIHHLRKDKHKTDEAVASATVPSNGNLKVSKVNDAEQVKQEAPIVTSPQPQQAVNTAATDPIKEDADLAQLEAMIYGGKNGGNKGGSKSVFYDPEMPLGDPGTGSNEGLMDYLEQETAYVNQIQEGSQSSDPHKQLLHIAKLLLMHKNPHASMDTEIGPQAKLDSGKLTSPGGIQNISISAMTPKINGSQTSSAVQSPLSGVKLAVSSIKADSANANKNTSSNVHKESSKAVDTSKLTHKVENANFKPTKNTNNTSTSSDESKSAKEDDKEIKHQETKATQAGKEENANQNLDRIKLKEPLAQDTMKELGSEDTVKEHDASNVKNESVNENEDKAKTTQQTSEIKEEANSTENTTSNPHPENKNAKEVSTANQDKDKENDKLTEKPDTQSSNIAEKTSDNTEEQPQKPAIKENNFKNENKNDDASSSQSSANVDNGTQADLSSSHELTNEPSDSHDKSIDTGIGSEVSDHVVTPLKDDSGRVPDGVEPKFKDEGPTVSQVRTSANGQTVIKETVGPSSRHTKESDTQSKMIHPEGNEVGINVKETEVVRKLPGLPLTNPGTEHYEVPVRTLKIKPFSRYHTYTGDDGQVSRVLNSLAARSSTTPPSGLHTNSGFSSMSAINGKEQASFEGPSTLTSLHPLPILKDVSPSTRSILTSLYRKKLVPLIPSTHFGVLSPPVEEMPNNANSQQRDELPSNNFKSLLSEKLKNLFGRQSMSASPMMNDETKQVQKSRTITAAKKSIQDFIDSLRRNKQKQKTYLQSSNDDQEQTFVKHHGDKDITSMSASLSSYRKTGSQLKDIDQAMNRKETHPQSSFGMIVAKSNGPETGTNFEVGVDPMDVTRSRLAHKPRGPSIADVLFRLGEAEKHSNVTGNHAKSAIRNTNSILKMEGKTHIIKGSNHKSTSKKSLTESIGLKPRSLDAMFKKLREDKNLSSLLLKRRTVAVNDNDIH